MAGFADPDDPDTIRIPFIFVPHGHPPPTEWLRDHPGALRVPAVFVPRRGGGALQFDWQAAMRDNAPPAVVPVRSQTAGRMPGPPGLLPDAAEDYRRLLRWWRRLTGPDWEHPDRWAEPRGQPDIVEANPRPDRNAGLSPPLQALPWRYKRAAVERNPDVAYAARGQAMSVHHLIGVGAASKYLELLMAAARVGWRMDEPDNLMLLPSTREAQVQLEEAGIWLPLHDNSHPQWTRKAMAGLAAIERDLKVRFGDSRSEARERASWIAVKMLQAGLRRDALAQRRIIRHGMPALDPPA